jgi:hypothetical protein
MDKKQALKLISSLFILLIFIASYAAFDNAPPLNAKANTTTVPVTFPSIGFANATIIGYGTTSRLYINCNLSEIYPKLSNTLQKLELNNSLGSYYSPSANLTLLYMGNMTPLELYKYISNEFKNESKCIEMNATTYLLLPPNAEFNISGKTYSLPIPSKYRNATLSMQVGNYSSVRLRIFALITENGSIYSMTES